MKGKSKQAFWTRHVRAFEEADRHDGRIASGDAWRFDRWTIGDSRLSSALSSAVFVPLQVGSAPSPGNETMHRHYSAKN